MIVTLVETVRLAPRLGVAFADAATGRPVADVAVTDRRDGTSVGLSQGRSGVFALHRRGAQAVTLDVDDATGRYLRLTIAVAADASGLVYPPGGPPTSGQVPRVALHLAPAAALPMGFAAVRADCWDADRNRPAAHALLTVRAPDGQRAEGRADDRGRLLVALPWPEPPAPVDGGSALTDVRWSLEVTVRYGRLDPAVPPELGALLAQPAARLLAAVGGPAFGPVSLRAGHDLVLRSAPPTDPPDVLLLTTS